MKGARYAIPADILTATIEAMREVAEKLFDFFGGL